MIVTSLRTRVFLLVAAILVLVAAFVMLVSQRTVTDTVYRTEDRATGNMLQLVALDISARYRQLLREKISTVRSFRGELEAYGVTVQDTLQAFEQIARDGALSEPAAQALALRWLDTLASRSGARILVYDDGQRVLNAHGTSDHGRDFSTLHDIKGRTPATDVYTDSDQALFSVYRWPDARTGEIGTHFGYFRLFSPWNWVVVISNAADAIEEAVNHRRNEIVIAASETLRQLTLSRSGFIFLFSGDQSLVVPPPAHAAGLVNESDQHSGLSLLAMLRTTADPAHNGQARFSTGGRSGQTWEVDAEYIKALDWYIASVVPRSDLLQPAHQLLRLQGAIFLAMLGLALLLAWFYAARLIRPLNLLTQYARTLPERDLTANQPVPAAIAALPDQHRDEVGRLATTILFMEQQLVSNVRRLMTETSERERIESELSIARDIQLGLLPLPLAPSLLAKMDLHATMNAAKEVGGDLYDYFMMEDGRLCFAIGDVSGKGVPAALFMAITRTLIRTAARQERSAATIMGAVNERLADHNPNMMFVTLFIGVLDLDTGELQYTNAGHPLPWLLTDGEVDTLPGRSGPACGVAEGIPYQEYSTVLAPGTLLIGYTDGVTEAADVSDTLYGEDRAIAVLASQPPAVTGAAVALALHQDIQAFAGEAEQADDITLILICRYQTVPHPN